MQYNIINIVNVISQCSNMLSGIFHILLCLNESILQRLDQLEGIFLFTYDLCFSFLYQLSQGRKAYSLKIVKFKEMKENCKNVQLTYTVEHVNKHTLHSCSSKVPVSILSEAERSLTSTQSKTSSHCRMRDLNQHGISKLTDLLVMYYII